jgi:hypothetical protein
MPSTANIIHEILDVMLPLDRAKRGSRSPNGHALQHAAKMAPGDPGADKSHLKLKLTDATLKPH